MSDKPHGEVAVRNVLRRAERELAVLLADGRSVQVIITIDVRDGMPRDTFRLSVSRSYSAELTTAG